MSIEHAVIPDASLHQMKGAAAATSGQVPVANGAGATVFTSPFNACGQMSIINSVTATVVAAAGDATLQTNADYVQVVSGLASSSLVNAGFSTDHLIAQKAGVYRWMITASLLAAGTSVSALKLRVNSTNVTTKVKATTTATEVVSFSLQGLATLAVNDTISLYIANTVGNVTVVDATVTIERLGVL